jgi:hypothetical protein
MGDLTADAVDEARIALESLEIHGRDAAQPGAAVHPLLSPAREGEAQPGAYEGVAAEDDRDRGVCRRPGQLAQPGIRDSLVQQEIRREPILGDRPIRFVRAETMGDQDAAIHERGPAELGEQMAE